MKRICVLLDNDILSDARVQRTVRALAKRFEVDLYYLLRNKNKIKFDFDHPRISTFPVEYEASKFFKKVIKHTFFYREHAFFEPIVRNSGRRYDYIWANDLPMTFPAVKLKKHFKVPLIFDSHEIYTESLNQFFPATATGWKKTLFAFLIA